MTNDQWKPGPIKGCEITALRKFEDERGWLSEFYRDDEGRAQFKPSFNRPLPDYGHFIRLMQEIGYDGYMCYELCHPVLDAAHEPAGLDYVEEQARLAQEYMGTLIRDNT